MQRFVHETLCKSVIFTHFCLNFAFFFETDNLYTLGENTEFMLSFLATFAQEESVKKSEAMNWSIHQRFKDGKLLTPAPLGYDRQKDITGRYIKYKRSHVMRQFLDKEPVGFLPESSPDFRNDSILHIVPHDARSKD